MSENADDLYVLLRIIAYSPPSSRLACLKIASCTCLTLFTITQLLFLHLLLWVDIYSSPYINAELDFSTTLS